jgi:hypothetical protein
MHVVILNLLALSALLFCNAQLLHNLPTSRVGPEVCVIQTRPNFGCPLIIKYLKKIFFLNNVKLRLDNAFSLNYIKINKNINPDYSVL